MAKVTDIASLKSATKSGSASLPVVPDGERPSTSQALPTSGAGSGLSASVSICTPFLNILDC